MTGPQWCIADVHVPTVLSGVFTWPRCCHSQADITHGNTFAGAQVTRASTARPATASRNLSLLDADTDNLLPTDAIHALTERLIFLFFIMIQAETFWLPSDSDPTTSLEKIVKSIFDFHNKNLNQRQTCIAAQLSPAPGRQRGSRRAALSDPGRGDASDDHPRSIGHKRPRGSGVSCKHCVPGEGYSVGEAEAASGAEWWIQVREEDRHSDLGMPFHWDKDEVLLEQKGLIVCPAVSTVTYLTCHGAPTVVLEVCTFCTCWTQRCHRVYYSAVDCRYGCCIRRLRCS